MATFKHISSKNADYGAAEAYLTFEHDEFTMKPTLDENGRLIPREDYRNRCRRASCGGRDDADNSGELQYVRVEFAGYPFKTDQEINGITFGSVGSGTKIDHLQVSYSNDDSYEWFGGTVDCKYLVAYHGWDDDFDTDNGFSGKVQYALGVRHPCIVCIVSYNCSKDNASFSLGKCSGNL